MRWFLLLVLLLSCNHGLKPIATPHQAPRVGWLFHADTDFTPGERDLIAHAVADIEAQTNGIYVLAVVYDLDFHSEAFRSISGQAWLVRAESCYPQITLADQWRKHPVLGMTITAPRGAPQVYLPIDRLQSAAKFQHVVMHEFLHAAGLNDLGGPGNVMSGISDDPVLCMQVPDMQEFCRVQQCKIEELRGCW